MNNRMSLSVAGWLGCALVAFASSPALAARYYDVDYTFRLQPDDGIATVTIELGDNANLVREIRLRIDPERHSAFDADGELVVDDNYATWTPPKDGGGLTYTIPIDNKRRSGRYDARMTQDWALFRGDDLVPPATVRTLVGAESRARLRFEAPSGWSTVTPYTRLEDDSYVIENDGRRFDRPTGWMLAGNVGLRLEDIAGTKVVVAGPYDQGVRRMTILAMLNWNLPELVKVFPDYHDKLLIVSANDPMWRGGLSGPASLYIHADRPVISENGTSSLLHEIVHTAMRLSSSSDDDWIVEGFAEYYSLQLMLRSGTITQKRYDRALRMQAEWGEDVTDLRSSNSRGENTARSVGVMVALDAEIREATGGAASIDDVAAELASGSRDVSLDRFIEVAETVAGTSLSSIDPANLPLD